jgi:drug/metabolite transporter (DMT)-like permease
MWIALSLFSGLSDALRDATSKYGAGRVPRIMVAWSYSLFALPYFLPILVLQKPAHLPASFWLLAGCMGITHVVGSLGLVYALSVSELSLCIPMIAFSPVFLLVVGPLVNGHTPSGYAVGGTLLVTLGCYLLNISDLRKGLLAPIRALGRDRGVRVMLALALLWSVTAAIDLEAVRTYGLGFWAAAELTAIALAFLPWILATKPYRGMNRGSWGMLAGIGLWNALSFGPYLVALSSAHALSVICLKRCNIFFALILGRVVFNENSLRGRLIGASLMFAGLCILTILG